MNQEFIHFESHIPREHARYKLPLNCVVGDRLYAVVEWSLAGFTAETVGHPVKSDEVQPAKLIFPLDGFDFVLDVQVVLHSQEKDNLSEFRYVALKPAQKRVFRYVLDAYLAGEIVTAGEILDVVKREDPASERKAPANAAQHKNTPRSWLGPGLRLVFVTLLSLGLVVFVAAGLSQRFSRIPTQFAVTAVDSTPVFAQEAGVLSNVVSGSVGAGEPIATILSESGRTVTLFSPCDCIISADAAAQGSSVNVGTQVVSLTAPDSAAYVAGLVDPQYVFDLHKGVTATVEFPDGRVVSDLQLTQLPIVSASTIGETDSVEVRVGMGEAGVGLEPGQPVILNLVRQRGFAADLTLQSAATALSTAFGNLVNPSGGGEQ